MRSCSRATHRGQEYFGPADDRFRVTACSQRSCPRFHFQGIIGTGSFSDVRLAFDALTGRQVAVKLLPTYNVRQNQRLQQILSREINILMTLSHPNIIQFVQLFTIRGHICLATEHMRGGELYQRISDHGAMREADAKHIFKQILAGMFVVICGSTHIRPSL